MLYLASPYSHPDPTVREHRAMLAARAAGVLMTRGEKVFSPVAHSYFIQQKCIDIIQDTHEFWLVQDFEVLRFCQELVILQLPGWGISVGIQEEIDFANMLSIPIRYCHPASIWQDSTIWDIEL